MANFLQQFGAGTTMTTPTNHPVDQPSFGGHSHGGQPQYLPEYLLGESTSSVTTSPMHSHRLYSSSFNANNDSYRAGQSSVKNNKSLTSTTPSRLNSRGSIGGDKQGGPPTQGLFVSSGATSPSNMSRSFVNESSSFARTPVSEVGSNNVSSMSPAQLDPFYTQGYREALKADDELDGTWVTVFGFAPSAVSFVLQQFSQYGNILEHKMSGGNNWIHLHYQSRIQAKKALGKNGKIFCCNMMVGVTQCIDKSVMNESIKENVSFANSPLSFNLACKDSGSVGRSTSRITGMRPLSEAYSAAANDRAVVSGNCTPQRKGGVVNKAMEYVFGW